MGLTTTHDCWDASYRSFNQFRCDLAEQIGIDLDDYIGYRGNGVKDITTINHNLMPLFNHSDCDGHLTIDECFKIANGIDSVLATFTDSTEQDSLFKEDMIRFRDGCLDAFSKNEIVYFR